MMINRNVITSRLMNTYLLVWVIENLFLSPISPSIISWLFLTLISCIPFSNEYPDMI